MSQAFKTVILCLLLLAMPLQSVAAATMIACSSMHEQPAQALLNDIHHDASALTLIASSAHIARHAQDAGGCHHPLSKCSVCAACCTGVATMPTVTLPLFKVTGSHEAPRFASALRGTLPDALERPPRQNILT